MMLWFKNSRFEAVQIFEAAENVLQDQEYEVNSMQVLKLSQETGCSAYDCEFVNLAQDLNLPLITMDTKLLNNFKKTAISIQEYIKKY